MIAWQLLLLEIVVMACAVIVAYELRRTFGWSLLYIFVGSIQYLQTILASSLYLPLTPNHLVSPGSVVLFTSSLFAILLIYIREGLRSTRDLIYGVIFANLTLTGLSLLTGWQLEAQGAVNFLNISPQVFQVKMRHFLVGTGTLAIDAILIVLLYDLLRSKWSHIPLLARLVCTMTAVLCFDAVVFTTGAFWGTPDYWGLLESNLVGKVFGGSVYGLLLFGYVRVTPGSKKADQTQRRVRDTVSFLTYRQKYEESQRLLDSVRQDAERLEVARDTALAADQAKTSYIANVSHEIRTPLNGIIGTIELMTEVPASEEEQERYLSILRTSASTLSRLIDDVLDLAKIETGNLSLEPRKVNPAEITAETVELYRALASNKGLRLDLEVADGCHRACWLDEVRFRQILGNLVSNAIKFTAEGGVTVRLEPQDVSQDHWRVRLTVEDTGVGIPEDAIDKIFDVYQQAERSTTRRFGGTGLGLAITKQLIELQGGRIEVQSEVGRGSVFQVLLELPLQPPFEISGTLEKIELRSFKGGQEKQHRPSVMIVDDDEICLKVTGGLLEVLEIESRLFEDPEEAIHAFSEHRPDMVMTDLNMGSMHGIELTRRLRQFADSESIPIVAVTASAFKSEKEACLAAGLDGYLTKPIGVDKLEKLLREWRLKD